MTKKGEAKTMSTVYVGTPKDEVDVRGGTVSAEELWELADGAASLRATYGERWTQVPLGFGEAALRARDVLTAGLVTVDVETADPVRVVQDLSTFAGETAATAAQILTEAALLGEALGSDLSSLPIAQLAAVCQSLLRLAEAPAPNPSWAHPAQARAASMVLGAVSDELREVATVRRWLYDEFSEDIWGLSCAKRPPSVDGLRDCLRRHRAKSQLSTVNHTGNPVDVKAAISALRRAHELTVKIDGARATLRGHLGSVATAGIPDVDGATEALGAIRDLQIALGDRLEVECLRGLAAADAFVCDELTRPATQIMTTIAGWRPIADQLHAVDATSLSPEELAEW